MLESFLTHAIPPTRVRLLIRGAVSPRDHLSAPPAKESSTRARRPRRLVDLLTVLKGRLFLVDDVKQALADPSVVLRLAANLLAGIRLEPFPSKQALLSADRLRRSRYRPYIEQAQPAV